VCVCARMGSRSLPNTRVQSTCGCLLGMHLLARSCLSACPEKVWAVALAPEMLELGSPRCLLFCVFWHPVVLELKSPLSVASSLPFWDGVPCSDPSRALLPLQVLTYLDSDLTARMQAFCKHQPLAHIHSEIKL